MKKVKILVACGSGIATSTIAADVVKSICEKEEINYQIMKCSMTELPSKVKEADIVLTTNNYKGSLEKPHMNVFGFISGINESKLRKELAKKLKEIASE